MRRVAIVGAGIVGRLLAFRMSLCGWKVHLFEKRQPSAMDACSFAASGMLSPYCELESTESSIFHLGMRSLSLWPDILDELSTPVFFQRKGSLVVAHPYDQVELKRLQSRIADSNVPGGHVETIGREELHQLEPELEDRFSTGLYFAEEGQIDNRGVMQALLAELREREVVCSFDQTVTAIRPHEITLNADRLTFEIVVDCRGLGAKSDLPALRGVRGELIHVHAPEVDLKRPVRLMHPKYPLYAVPRPGSRYLIGATSIESDSEHGLTVRSALELLSAAYALHPAFAEATLEELVTQIRPAFADNLPRVYHQPGLVQINGMYRHGFLIAPAVIQSVSHLLAEGKPFRDDSFLFKEVA